MFRSGAAFQVGPLTRKASPVATFRQGVLTNLLNPKAYLFMLAVFPQFLRPEYGPLWLQGVVLWVIIALTQATVYGAIALAADRARGWLESRPAATAMVARGVGVLMVGAALLTAVEGWRST